MDLPVPCRPRHVARLETPEPVPYGVLFEPEHLGRFPIPVALPEQFKACDLCRDFDWFGLCALGCPIAKLPVVLLRHLSPFHDKKETSRLPFTVSQIRGVVQKGFTPPPADFVDFAHFRFSLFSSSVLIVKVYCLHTSACHTDCPQSSVPGWKLLIFSNRVSSVSPSKRFFCQSV